MAFTLPVPQHCIVVINRARSQVHNSRENSCTFYLATLGAAYIGHSSTSPVHNLMKSQLYTYLGSGGWADIYLYYIVIFCHEKAPCLGYITTYNRTLHTNTPPPSTSLIQFSVYYSQASLVPRRLGMRLLSSMCGFT